MSEDNTPKTITSLEAGVLPRVTQTTIDKIRRANITTVEALSVQNPKTLAEEAGIGEDTAQNAIEKAQTYTNSGYITGDQLLTQLRERTHLTTGSEAVDNILNGGIESETITEIAAKNGIGKTQVCHMLAVTAQLPIEQGGLNGNVALIDTEGTFRPERILEICNARGLNGQRFIENIYYGYARTVAEQRKLIRTLYRTCPENNIKLVIVDSIIGPLRGEYLGRGTLSSRQDVLKDMLQTLLRLALSTKVTVVYTNQIMSDPGVMYGNPDRPTGGNVMGHAATTRLQIRKARLDKRILTVTKSAYLPECEAVFRITTAGVEDTEDYLERKQKRQEKEEENEEAG